MSRVLHFEIHAQDPLRAVEFYKAVFGWKAEKWDGPEEYWTVVTGEEGVGINGGIMRRRGNMPEEESAVSAYVCVIGTLDLDQTLERISSNGGLMAVPKMAVPGVGWLAYCKDTEANIFGILQSDQNAL
jgi:uncharacterized protein